MRDTVIQGFGNYISHRLEVIEITQSHDRACSPEIFRGCRKWQITIYTDVRCPRQQHGSSGSPVDIHGARNARLSVSSRIPLLSSRSRGKTCICWPGCDNHYRLHYSFSGLVVVKPRISVSLGPTGRTWFHLNTENVWRSSEEAGLSIRVGWRSLWPRTTTVLLPWLPYLKCWCFPWLHLFLGLNIVPSFWRLYSDEWYTETY